MDILEQTYPNTPVPLNNKNVFELLVAVLLSAQCTDERVNKVTPSLFKIADNPFDMEKIPVEKIYEIIKIFVSSSCDWFTSCIYNDVKSNCFRLHK